MLHNTNYITLKKGRNRNEQKEEKESRENNKKRVGKGGEIK